MLGKHICCVKERLRASLPPKKLPNVSNIPLSFLSESLPSKKLCPVLTGVESSQVLQQVCHAVYQGTLPCLSLGGLNPPALGIRAPAK